MTASLVTLVASMAGAHPSWGIVVSSTGVVYFSDLETVWKIDRDGRLSIFRAGVGGRHVHELAIDELDNLYGPDSVYDPTTQKYLIGVWKKTPDGKETRLQQPIDSLMSGVSIWRDRAGNMYSIEQNNNRKERTLLLKRTPNGQVLTLAGGTYGHADGQGSAAKFSSVYAMTIATDSKIYLTDGTSVRRVTLDGDVATVAQDLSARTSDDKPTLFGGDDKILAGVAADSRENVYVADAGNRRLLKTATDGKVGVVYRCDPPYFPTGVFATTNGDVYVLEFSYTPPGTTDNPRVRRISSDGKSSIIASTSLMQTGVRVSPPGEVLRSRFQSGMAIVTTRLPYVVLLVMAGVVILTFLAWHKGRKQRT